MEVSRGVEQRGKVFLTRTSSLHTYLSRAGVSPKVVSVGSFGVSFRAHVSPKEVSVGNFCASFSPIGPNINRNGASPFLFLQFS